MHLNHGVRWRSLLHRAKSALCSTKINLKQAREKFHRIPWFYYKIFVCLSLWKHNCPQSGSRTIYVCTGMTCAIHITIKKCVVGENPLTLSFLEIHNLYDMEFFISLRWTQSSMHIAFYIYVATYYYIQVYLHISICNMT